MGTVYTKSAIDAQMAEKITKPTTSLSPSTSVTIQTLIDLGLVTYEAPTE